MGSVFSQPAECAAPGYPLGRDGNGLPGLQNDDLPFHPDVQQLRRNEVFLRHEDRPAMVSDFFPEDPTEVFHWHPNRTHAAIVQFLASQYSHPKKRRITRKGLYPQLIIQAWANGTENE